ncbi:AmmeMemoRadiSam system protein B (plasmid) [Rhizobium leguminosarum bv. trifolii]|uniref:AmmeMemoRadiSam system protein B n=1 Tax=Rhizobium ruizarguesonis TaxID=2081791 RepID=UPI0010313311|nr:AmmeMemoRadiSam system protein B [Rhizobium ruizarguesonis]QIO48702.1 AmmeMemoRadiSam system protein B [Rhizobium leguminosarum bv. trifolii]TAW39019.1 AmmeMemoRadiSam system protein B [Rhizobium ruizarguesonis]TAY06406.1 AmmeMemoRadiSam system protein B [Rhizobium ruizarguesonis]
MGKYIILLLIVILSAATSSAGEASNSPSSSTSGTADDERSDQMFAGSTAFPARYTDNEPFASAIARAERTSDWKGHVTGLIVPHHLLAAEYIARGFRSVDQNKIDNVVILFPDHFKKTYLPFATTKREFETVFGTVQTNADFAGRLLAEADIVQDSDLFAQDHGIGAILPFVKYYLPKAKVVPVAVAIRSKRVDWDHLVAAIEPLLTPGTLIVQSTDFSHYLPLAAAVKRDQETLNVLAAGDPDAAAALLQPANTDSRGALYIQMKLQADIFHATPWVIANDNSQIYSDVPQSRTTSHMLAVYQPDSSDSVGQDSKDSDVYCFAGDTFFGRYIETALANPAAEQRLLRETKRFLGHCPLIVNLEGVVLHRMPHHLRPPLLGMKDNLTIRWLHSLGVVAVGLANNHVHDFGMDAFRKMTGRLRRSGLIVLHPGKATKVGRLSVVALTDLDNFSRMSSGVICSKELKALARRRFERYVAFIHWGVERQSTPTARQLRLTTKLAEAGVGLIVGAHSHTRSLTLVLSGEAHHVLTAYSLGNLVFDQTSRFASGAILETRVFKQGTMFSRLVPIPNYFDLMRQTVSKR